MMHHPMSLFGKWFVPGLLTWALCFGIASVRAGDRRTDLHDPDEAKPAPKLVSFLKTEEKFSSLFKKVMVEARESTVLIRSGGRNVALGTVVDSDGWIMTKASVLGGGTPQVLFKDGREFDAKIIGEHKQHDLCLLKIEAQDLITAQWRSSKKALVGFWTVSVGWGANPMALGVVSVGTRKINYPKDYLPRPSGSTGYLGVALSQSEEKAIVDQVLPKTGAAKAGLRANDIILAVSGHSISSGKNLIATLRKYQPGDTIVVKIQRGEDEMEIRATLGKRPMSRGDLQNNLGSKLSKRIDGFPVILQHDGIVLPDQCGGPLVDLDGKVIGINISRAGRTESYAIPSEVVLEILADMKSGKFAVAKNTPTPVIPSNPKPSRPETQRPEFAPVPPPTTNPSNDFGRSSRRD